MSCCGSGAPADGANAKATPTLLCVIVCHVLVALAITCVMTICVERIFWQLDNVALFRCFVDAFVSGRCFFNVHFVLFGREREVSEKGVIEERE